MDSDTARWVGGASYGAAIVSMIDRKMKEHANRPLRAAHGISRKITQLENRTSQLEGLIDNLKDTTEFYHRRSERRLREVEDMMTEVLCAKFSNFLLHIDLLSLSFDH